LRNEDLVTFLHAHGDALSALVDGTGPNSQNARFQKVLDGGLGEKETTCGFGIGLDALDKNAVEKRDKGPDGLDGKRLEDVSSGL